MPSHSRSRSRSPRRERSKRSEHGHDRKRSKWDDEDESRRDARSHRRERRDSRERERDTRRDRDSTRDRDRDRRKDGGRSKQHGDRDKDRDRRRDRSRSRERTKDRSHSKDAETSTSLSQFSSKNRKPLPDNNPFSKDKPQDGDDKPPIEKEKPNYAVTTHLISETNTLGLKYAEPSDARLPPSSDQWRLFIFKGPDVVDTIHLNSRTCWLFGRDGAVADVRIDHPSCSKQHAVIQFRFKSTVDEWGERKGKVRPYAIDLESANGTFLNKERIEAARHVELQEKDMVVFGLSAREYILMLEK